MGGVAPKGPSGLQERAQVALAWQACKTGKAGVKPGLKPRGRRVKPLKPDEF